MFCPKCGASIEDGAKFCPNCGESIAVETPAAPAAAESAVPPVQQTVGNDTAPLVLGILSLALCSSGLISLILGIIGKSKAKKFLRENGRTTVKSKLGSIFSTLGIVFSIIMMVCILIYAVIFAAAIISGELDLSNLGSILDNIQNY